MMGNRVLFLYVGNFSKIDGCPPLVLSINFITRIAKDYLNFIILND